MRRSSLTYTFWVRDDGVLMETVEWQSTKSDRFMLRSEALARLSDTFLTEGERQQLREILYPTTEHQKAA